MSTMKKLFHSPLQPWNLAKLVIQFLLLRFDTNRLLYCFIVFPVYQIASFIGIAAIIFLWSNLDGSIGMYFAFCLSIIFVGFPILMTWHLSCALFFKAQFELFGVHKWPFSGLVTGPNNSLIDMYR